MEDGGWRMEDARFRVCGSGFLGFKVCNLGLTVRGLGFRV
jgi:hypothetical protein